MSLEDYRASMRLSDEPFYALIMAAMRRADTDNAEKLKAAWPRVWEELQQRYNAPGGCITEIEYKSEFEGEF
ncbi:hypothetical protein ES705_32284 [subsurface metagenome]